MSESTERRLGAIFEDRAARISSILAEPNLATSVNAVAARLASGLLEGGTVAFCGNGGSASQASHLAAELAGRFMKDREPYRAISLNADTSVITALSNDFGYERVFERQVRGLLKSGDSLVVLSTSGASANCENALLAARGLGISTVGMTGAEDDRNSVARIADYAIIVPATESYLIQEVTLVIGHSICQIVEDILSS